MYENLQPGEIITNQDINPNDGEINLDKNNNINNSNFNKFFEESNQEIVVETLEQSDEVDISIDDDIIYEIDVYNNLISGLSLSKQNNPKIQEKYLKISRHLINLKNKSQTVDLGDIEDYKDLQKTYNNEFNTSWIIPIVLDKKKIYKKIDISSENDEDVMENYINTASNKGIQFEDFFDELKKEIQYQDEFNRDKLSFKSYRQLIYDINQPYLIKKEIKKKDIGYNLYLNQYTELLRFFNIDNKFWQQYINNGPERFSYLQYDEDGKIIGSREAQISSGAQSNIIGLLVLGSKEDYILDSLKGESWFDRIRKLGVATKIEKNKNAIIDFKNHGFKNGEKVMILNSNSEPSIDGEFSVKVINENKFMIPVDTEEGKEGDFAEIYGATGLNFKKIQLNKGILDIDTKEDYSDNYFDNSVLYLFPDEEINDEEWKQICKKIIPRAGAIINNQKEEIEKAKTIEDINNILRKFSIEFKNLGWSDYFTLTEILDEKYLEEKSKQSKFDFDKYYGEIIALRSKIIGQNKEEDVENDIIFGNKYILSKEIIKYYGNYPNAGTDVDSVGSRYNWIIGTPDYGKLYFLNMELEKIRSFEDISVADVEKLKKEIEKEIKDAEKEIKGTKNSKNCENRIIEPIKIYDSYESLFKDRGKITDFNVGDYALIENTKSHENGMIYVWNGINWTQNILIKNLDDLCLLGVEKLKDFDLEKLDCLFKKACKNKKQVRLEKKIDRLEAELSLLDDLTHLTTKEIEKRLKEEIKIAELNLQIYLREYEDTRKKDTIEVYEQDFDPIYIEIMKIPDADRRDELRNLLIKKDGILIDKDIFSIRTGKKICCGHYYYHLKIAQGGSPEYSEKMVEEMRAIFGSEEENGFIFCNHDGKPLMMVDYDQAEGLSKSTGEIDKQREVVIDEEEELKELVMELQSDEREAVEFECSSSDIRKELFKIGFKSDQVAKSKDICERINKLNGKTGIILKKKDFISVIVDVMQIFQKLPDFARFKAGEIFALKARGIDFKQVNPKKFQERYTDLVNIRKTTLIAARLLISYQTLIPPQYPTGKSARAVFEGFEGQTGLEYMANLIEESKIMPIHRNVKGEGESITYLPLGKVKEEIRKSYDDLSDLSSVKKMKKDKKVYESRKVRDQEEKIGVETKEFPKYSELPKNYQKEVEKAKKYEEFARFKKELMGRQKYIAYEIIKSINEAVSTSADRQRDDPKSLEISCCFEKLTNEVDYYKFIAEKANKNIYELLDESVHNSYYSALFLTGGMVMKHYPKRNANFHLNIKNLGVDNDQIKKHLFLTYIDNGIFKGEKHDFVDGICMITGEKEQDILKENYSDSDTDELIKAVIGKTVKKIIFGGTKEDEENLRKRDESLVDNIDFMKLKEESMNNLIKYQNNFVEKMGKLLNRSSNKDFMNELKERIDNLGVYNISLDRMEESLRRREQSSNESDRPSPGEYIELENERHRIRIRNLKKYINNYFRRYISMISNGYDPTQHIKELLDMDDATSREVQGFIARREDFVKNYMTKKDAELFKNLQFDLSSKVISNITAETDIWDKSYKKIEKEVNFNLSHLSNVLMFVLLNNLDNFISMKFEKEDIEKNKTIAKFVKEILDKIKSDESKLDFTPDTFVEGDYRAQEPVKETDEIPVKDDVSRMISEIDYKFKRVKDRTDFEEVYDELEEQDRRDTLKLKFMKEYKDKYDKDPNENEIMDYLDDMDKERQKDADEEKDEYMMSEIREEGEDVLEIGDGYGEMPQNAGGEDGDY